MVKKKGKGIRKTKWGGEEGGETEGEKEENET